VRVASDRGPLWGVGPEFLKEAEGVTNEAQQFRRGPHKAHLVRNRLQVCWLEKQITICKEPRARRVVSSTT